MIRTDKRLRLCTVLLVCNLVFIWGNSLMPGWISQALSDFVKSVLSGSGSSGGGGGSGALRKLAHLGEFAALGMLLSWRTGMLGKKQYLPLAYGIAAACIDETIQIFVPERGPGIRDVCLDSCGVVAGMILLRLGHSYYKRKKPSQYLEDK